MSSKSGNTHLIHLALQIMAMLIIIWLYTTSNTQIWDHSFANSAYDSSKILSMMFSLLWAGIMAAFLACYLPRCFVLHGLSWTPLMIMRRSTHHFSCQPVAVIVTLRNRPSSYKTYCFRVPFINNMQAFNSKQGMLGQRHNRHILTYPSPGRKEVP